MLAQLAERVIHTVLVLLMVVTVLFFSMRALPGGPLDAMLADDVPDFIKDEMARKLGLDRPLSVQYGLYLRDLLRGDLGRSIRFGGSPVTSLLKLRFPATLKLAVISVLLSALIGIVVGVVSATKPGSLFDYAVMFLTLLGRALPQFWLALILVLTFSVSLRLLPAGGTGTLRHLILPVISLAAGGSALIARLVRSSMLEVIDSDYIRTARAKGLSEPAVIYRHMVKNGLIPVITVIGLIFGFTMGGSVIVESIFAWPGMGRLIVEAIVVRDYPVVMGGILVFAATFAFVNFAVDMTYVYLDPRLRS